MFRLVQAKGGTVFRNPLLYLNMYKFSWTKTCYANHRSENYLQMWIVTWCSSNAFLAIHPMLMSFAFSLSCCTGARTTSKGVTIQASDATDTGANYIDSNGIALSIHYQQWANEQGRFQSTLHCIPRHYCFAVLLSVQPYSSLTSSSSLIHQTSRLSVWCAV